MADKLFLLVCEGPTDIYIFEALAAHFSDSGTKLQITTLAPQLDATSGTYLPHGFGKVLNWCKRNHNIQKLFDFGGANALFVQMDTDIAKQANPGCINQGHSARHCCQEKINDRLGTTQEPPRCYYILPTENTETWILASHQPPELDANSTEISNYELITDTEQRLIKRGYPSKKGRKRNVRKLNKEPAHKYQKYGKQLTTNLTLARQRCAELNRLCILLEIATGTILMTSAETTSRPYFRRDQRDGISPPDLSKECTFAEHIVHARGKRTQYTSVSLDPNKIKDFGDTTYRLKRQQTEADKHIVIEHDSLLTELQRTIREQDKADRARAIQALRYATQRQEGLVKWQFEISRLERKEIIAWATTKVQIYFTKV